MTGLAAFLGVGTSPREPAIIKQRDRPPADSRPGRVKCAPVALWLDRTSVARRPSKQKGPPHGAAPHVLCLAYRRRAASPDVGDAFLSFHFGRSGRLRGQLKHGGLLAFDQFGQEDHLPIRKFKGIMMHARLVFVDLPEDRCPGGHPPRTKAEETGCRTCDLLGERKLSSRKDAYRGRGIFGRGEPTSTGPEVARRKLVANFCRTRLHIL